jgi:hypothetical protein
LDVAEIRKRFLTGLTFADGIVLTPNTVIDNIDIHSLITKKNVVKYLNEEGSGKFVIRGFNLNSEFSLVEHFENLRDDYIFSSIPNTPRKSNLSTEQETEVLNRLDNTQRALDNITPKIESIPIKEDSLQNEVIARIGDDEIIGNFFDSDGDRLLFSSNIKNVVSRSQWYEFSDRYFGKKSLIESYRFKAEIIDPAYNSLFAVKGEGFLQDNIKIINDVPEIILDAGVVFKSLRNEIKYIEYPVKAFELITSFGAGQITKYLTDEALNYIEDKFQDKGESYISRKNWFGMYNLMKNKIGLEVK